MTGNGYVIELSGWEAFFTAVENHWVTALFMVGAIYLIATAFSPTINNIIKKGE